MATTQHRRQRLSLLGAAALAVVSFIGFANVYNYSNPDSFLGLALAGQGSGTGHVMLAYGVDGAGVVVTAILVLLSQSHPFVAAFHVSTKWWLVIAGQVVSVLTSITSIIWPMFIGITVSRAVHGIAEAVYMIYALVLLVELSPRKHLALGIACLTAGMTAGDSVGPVLGAIMYDATGIRGAFSLQAAINALSMLLTILMIPMWIFSPQRSKDQLLQAQTAAGPSLPVVQGHLAESSDAGELPVDDAISRSRQKNTDMLTELKKIQKQQHEESQQQISDVIPSLRAPGSVVSHTHHLCGDAQKNCNSSSPAKTAADTLTHVCSARAAQALIPASPASSCNESKCTCASTNAKLCLAATQQANNDSCTPELVTDQINARVVQQPGGSADKQLSTTTPCNSLAVSTRSDDNSSSGGSNPQPTSKLDLSAVVDTLKDPVIFSQCVLLLLEQVIRSTLTVVLPAAMGTRQLVVGMVYIANVAGSVTSPFLIDAYMARKNNKCSTHMLAAGISIIMGLSCAAVVPLSKTIAALVIILIIAGSTQAAIETLVYVHVAKRLDSLGKHTATQVSMCMYILAQTTGGGLGSLVGSALLLQSWVLQIIVAGAVCVVVGVYGAVLSLVTHKKTSVSSAQ